VSSWPVARLGDIARFQNGRAFKPSEWSAVGLPIIRIENLTDASAQFHWFEGLVDERHLVRDGDLLVSWSASLDAFIWNRGLGVLNQHIFKVAEDASLLDRSYFFHALRHSMTAIRAQVHGATMQHITKPAFEAVTIPLPPLDEQRRIAARLHDQLATADSVGLGVERRLETLARVREEVLASTFARIEAPSIALGVAVSATGAIADGPFGSHLKTEHYARNGVRVIRLQNIGSGAFLDHDRAFVTAEHAESLTRHSAREGDVVVAALGDGARPAGRACQVPDIGPALVKADCFRVRTDNSSIDPGFLVWFLNSPRTQAAIAGQMRGATRPRVTLAMLRTMTIPLPPLDDQRRIAALLREQLAEIDHAKAGLVAQRTAVDALPAALLREVFGAQSAA
jgi:type I restriction enzyme S subunit